MARHYPELNLEWLITGRGKMYGGSKSASDAPAETISPLPSQTQPGLFDDAETVASTPSRTPLPAQSVSRINLDKTLQSFANQRTISKVIIFFTDGSFQELP
jgi:hypothetical protein